MLSFLKRSEGKLKDAWFNFTKRDDMERAAYVAVSVGFADGTMGPEERTMTPRLLAQMFRNFSPGEVAEVVNRAIEDHSVSAEMGFIRTEELLEGVESKQEVRKLFGCGVAIAKSNGEVDPKEKQVLSRFAAKMGLTTAEIGL